jgi:hypothetical protein
MPDAKNLFSNFWGPCRKGFPQAVEFQLVNNLLGEEFVPRAFVGGLNAKTKIIVL